jgi:hypothetical protein
MWATPSQSYPHPFTLLIAPMDWEWPKSEFAECVEVFARANHDAPDALDAFEVIDVAALGPSAAGPARRRRVALATSNRLPG